MPARPRVAHLVSSLPPSGIRRFFDLVAATEGVISLGVGEPDFKTPEVIRQAAVDRIMNGSTAYSSNAGLLETRAALARFLDKEYNVQYDPREQVIMTVGASQGIDLAMRAILEPNDEVIVIEPCYVSYGPMVVLAGGRPIFVGTRAEDGFLPDPERIEAAITKRTRAMLLGYPNNPTGATYPPDLLEALADIARRHDLIVVSDEIYAGLVYDAKHVSIASLDEMIDRTILLGGFSKTYSMTGWRLGYAAGPKDILSAMLKIHQYGMLCAPTVAQAAAIVALEQAGPDAEAMRQEYHRRRDTIVAALDRIGIPCSNPGGAFYVFADIRRTGMTDMKFCEELLIAEKVATVPGCAFGASGEGFVRMAYTVGEPKLSLALEKIASFVRHNAHTRG